MYSILKISLFISIFGILFFSCKKKDDPQPENQLEGINKIALTFAPVGGGNTVVFSITDADGPGGNAPVSVVPVLVKNKTYNVTVKVFSIAGGVETDETQEISDEGTAHQFFYETSNGLAAAFTYTDRDADGKPIGLATTCNSGVNASTGTLKITLKHELNKSASGISISSFANVGGDTDIEATFNNVSVQ